MNGTFGRIRAWKMTLRWPWETFSDSSDFSCLMKKKEKSSFNVQCSSFKLQAINLNLLSFYSVPMICGLLLLLNRICGQWIARVFDNFYPFNHQLTTNNIWTTDAHWSVTNSFVKFVGQYRKSMKMKRSSAIKLVCIG